jgi:transcription elongation factor GreA
MADNQDKVPLTKEGLAELKEELAKLAEDKRPQIVERMAKSREVGDMVEDSEYSQARQELSFIDGRISELEEVIARAKVVSTKNAKSDKIDLGSKVTVQIGKRKDHNVFHLVGEWEADPASLKISHQSPLGQALLGKKAGDRVEVEAPIGKLIYTIIKIN